MRDILQSNLTVLVGILNIRNWLLSYEQHQRRRSFIPLTMHVIKNTYIFRHSDLRNYSKNDITD